jgi:hypothetical protein
VQPYSQHFGAFAMFIDASFSIIAFLVLAHILIEKILFTINVTILHFGLPFTTCPSYFQASINQLLIMVMSF